MATKYNELMEKVVVTEEMRRRILQNLDAAQPQATPRGRLIRWPYWKNAAGLAACAAVCALAVLMVPSILRREPEVLMQPGSSYASSGNLSASSGEAPSQQEGASGAASQPGPAIVWYATPDAYASSEEQPSLGGNQQSGETVVHCETRAQLESTVGFSVEGVKYLPFMTARAEYAACGTDTAQIVYTGTGGETATWQKSSEKVAAPVSQWKKSEALVLNGQTVVLYGTEKGYFFAQWMNGGYHYSVTLSDGLAGADWESLLLKNR